MRGNSAGKLAVCIGLVLVSLWRQGHGQELLNITNTIWKYQPNLQDPGYAVADEWTHPEFDDSAWSSGLGLFGYETTPQEYPYPFQTVILPPSRNGGPSAYFRTHFNYTEPPELGLTAGRVLEFSSYVDDGMVVYLNGTELFSFNMPESPRPMTWDVRFLPRGAQPLGEGILIITNVAGSALVYGDNVLSVELHQQGVSGDDVFGMGLRVRTLGSCVTDQPTNRVLLANHTTRLIFEPPCLIGDATYQWSENGLALAGATNSWLTITGRLTSPAVSFYHCHLSSPLGEVTSRVASVEVVHFDPTPALRALATLSLTNVVLEFDELLDPASAIDRLNYFITGPGGPYEVQSAQLAVNGVSVILNISPPFTADQTYSVSVRYVKDLTGNELPPAELSFRVAPLGVCPPVRFEGFNGGRGGIVNGLIPGGAVSALTAHPTFPDAPSEVMSIDTFDGTLGYADGTRGDSGARLRSYFVPPFSGYWRFFLASRSASELWLNPAGPDAGGRIRIAEQTNYNDYVYFRQPGASQTSTVFLLVGGQKYYLETLWKIWFLGGQCQVAALPENDASDLQTLKPIPKEWLREISEDCGPNLTINRISSTVFELNWLDQSFYVETADSLQGTWTPDFTILNGSWYDFEAKPRFFRLAK